MDLRYRVGRLIALGIHSKAWNNLTGIPEIKLCQWQCHEIDLDRYEYEKIDEVVEILEDVFLYFNREEGLICM